MTSRNSIRLYLIKSSVDNQSNQSNVDNQSNAIKRKIPIKRYLYYPENGCSIAIRLHPTIKSQFNYSIVFDWFDWDLEFDCVQLTSSGFD